MKRSFVVHLFRRKLLTVCVEADILRMSLELYESGSKKDREIKYRNFSDLNMAAEKLVRRLLGRGFEVIGFSAYNKNNDWADFGDELGLNIAEYYR